PTTGTPAPGGPARGGHAWAPTGPGQGCAYPNFCPQFQQAGSRKSTVAPQFAQGSAPKTMVITRIMCSSLLWAGEGVGHSSIPSPIFSAPSRRGDRKPLGEGAEVDRAPSGEAPLRCLSGCTEPKVLTVSGEGVFVRDFPGRAHKQNPAGKIFYALRGCAQISIRPFCPTESPCLCARRTTSRPLRSSGVVVA